MSIQRFTEKIHRQHESILYEIESNTCKTGHWIWWAFPQAVPPEFWNIVSGTTQYYSITEQEVMLLLADPLFSSFYEKAIRILCTKPYLRMFFGPDLSKFKSHLILFTKIVREDDNAKDLYESLQFLLTNTF